MSRIIDREYILDCIERWGNHCSIAFLDPACQFFSMPEIEGVIGYRLCGNVMVLFGDPACPKDVAMQLMHAFYTYCKQLKKRICCIGCSATFTQQLLQEKVCASALAIGNEIILDLSIDLKCQSGMFASALRNKWRQSVKQGITVHEYIEHDIQLEQQFEELLKLWHAHRMGPQLYLAETEIFTHRKHRRWFYATYQNQLVGLLLLTQLTAQNGFVINYLFLAPDAPATTSEFIILSIVEKLSREGKKRLSVGLIPQADLEPMYGFNRFWKWIAKRVYRKAHKRYKLHRKEQYWKKFSPLKKELFVLFERQHARTADLLSILRALHAI